VPALTSKLLARGLAVPKLARARKPRKPRKPRLKKIRMPKLKSSIRGVRLSTKKRGRTKLPKLKGLRRATRITARITS